MSRRIFFPQADLDPVSALQAGRFLDAPFVAEDFKKIKTVDDDAGQPCGIVRIRGIQPPDRNPFAFNGKFSLLTDNRIKVPLLYVGDQISETVHIEDLSSDALV